MGESLNTALGLDADVRIIDADTHLTEPADLWTSRAPARTPIASRGSR